MLQKITITMLLCRHQHKLTRPQPGPHVTTVLGPNSVSKLVFQSSKETRHTDPQELLLDDVLHLHEKFLEARMSNAVLEHLRLLRLDLLHLLQLRQLLVQKTANASMMTKGLLSDFGSFGSSSKFSS